MKVAVISTIKLVGIAPTHHGNGYNKIVVDLLKEKHDNLTLNPKPQEYDNFDIIYILEGVNFTPGKFNLIGGPQPFHYERMECLHKFQGEVICLNNFVDLTLFATKLKMDLQYPNYPTQEILTDYGISQRKTVFGDSHSLSVHKKGYGLNRVDGTTLYSWLNNVSISLLNERYDKTITYYGNIDIRFHLGQRNNPIEATKELFNRYIETSSELNDNTIIGLLPIEHESRKMPTTGLYKGKPFYGSRELRSELRDIANEIIISSGQKYYMWPDEFNSEDGLKMFDYMEPRQSVHLKPKFYLPTFIQDYDTDI
jgi:hypothetical protein